MVFFLPSSECKIVMSNKTVGYLASCARYFSPFHSQVQEVHSPNLKEKCIGDVVTIGSII